MRSLILYSGHCPKSGILDGTERFDFLINYIYFLKKKVVIRIIIYILKVIFKLKIFNETIEKWKLFKDFNIFGMTDG